MGDFLNSPLHRPSEDLTIQLQTPDNETITTNTEHSRTKTSTDNKPIIPTKYHTSSTNTNVDINLKDTNLNSCINPLQHVETTVIQSPYKNSNQNSDHEIIFSKINTNKLNKCNASVNLLVDIEKAGNNIN